MSERMAFDGKEYRAWIGELKKRYRATQIKAAVAVNSALIEYYWGLGRDISEKYSEFTKSEIYGKQFFQRLSADLKDAMPGVAGHSPRNLRYCLDFFELYAGKEFFPHIVGKCGEKILQQVVAKSPIGFSLRKDAGGDSFCGENILQQLVAKLVHVPWGHHIVVIDKCKGNCEKAWFYVCRTNEHGWSRNMLLNMLSTDLYEREGKAQTNFELTLPKPESDLAEQLVKKDQTFYAPETLIYTVKFDDGTEDEFKVAPKTDIAKELKKFLHEHCYLQSRFGQVIPVQNQKGYTLSSLLPSASAEGIVEKSQTVSSLFDVNQILLISGDDIRINPAALFNRLSYSHIYELLKMPVDMMRTFYAFEAIRGCWSVRALRRQIDSQYYQRVGWAKDPHKLAALAQGRAEKLNPKDFVKQNTVLEFLGLKPQGDWDESDLEKGIIDNLKTFIREMGTGFCFEDQQQNILIDDVYERIDLVFYHRILKCHVLIELKPKKLNYKDVAQLNLYMAYYRKNKMTAGDNPPIGILLCTAAGKETVEYLAPFTDPQLFLSEYQLKLPTKEEITAFLKRENGTLEGSVK